MKITKIFICSLLAACTILFTTIFQVLPAISSADNSFETKNIADITDPSQSMPVIPGDGYLVRKAGQFSVLHEAFRDPVGRRIQEILEMDAREGTQQNPVMPMSEILVTNSADSGMGSLRWAIEQANSNLGPDIIHFSMSSAIISPITDLPPIVDYDTVIDASPNWSGIWPGGKPGIIIDGSSDTSGNPTGLRVVGASNVTIKGLEIRYFNYCIWLHNASHNTIGEGASTNGGGRMVIHNCNGPAIHIFGGQQNRVIGTYIGTSVGGDLPEPNTGEGISILDSQRNAIGGLGSMEGNIIGANAYGIYISGNNASWNTIEGNQIGSSAHDISNVNAGVVVGDGATYTAVGGRIFVYPGESPSFQCPDFGNYIENNRGGGVIFTGAGNSYNAALGNIIYGNQANGITVANTAQENGIGCNTITSNDDNGIFIAQPGTSGNQIFDNLIGIDYTYGPISPNGKHGIGLYDGTSDNFLTRNYIGNNGWSGVAIVGMSTSYNTLYRNNIGVGLYKEALGNKFFGVDIIESPDNLLTENIIAFNGSASNAAGVHIGEDTAVGNFLDKNSIYSNAGMGIELTNRSQHEIGAPVINHAQCPVVSGIGGPIGARIDIFSDAADEGRYYEGSVTVDDQYQWSYSGFFRGPNLTAIAIDLVNRDASMFSAPAIGAGSCNHIFLPIGFRNK